MKKASTITRDSDNYLSCDLTERHSIKFGYYRNHAYLHFRDYGYTKDKSDRGSHRHLTLNREATYRLAQVLPDFIAKLEAFDESNDPGCLEITPRGDHDPLERNKKRRKQQSSDSD